MRLRINRFNRIEPLTDSHDICFQCKNKTSCPLMMALRGEVVILRYEAVTVQNCKFFKNQEEQ